MDRPLDYESACRNPAACFAGPAELLAASGFTRQQKIAILRQWEYDEREIAVAQEEGMPGGDTALLRDIVAALASLEGPADDDAVSAPTKQRPRPDG